MGKIHSIKKGDSVVSLADAAGHFPDTIWKHPQNDALRLQRENMNILAVDDDIFIPEIETGMLPCAANMRHRFRRLGTPALYRLQLLRDGQPRKNLKYTLVIEDKLVKKTTDERGMIEAFIPPSIKEIQLFVGDEEYPRTLKIGELEPANSISGVQQRLRNLGYECPSSDSLDEATRAALRDFQQRAEIPLTGEPDEATFAAIRRAHDEIGGYYDK